MLRAGAVILTIWSGINFILAFLILTFLIFRMRNAPILAMVFEKSEISILDARVISSVNVLAILYNSCAAAISLLVLSIIWSSLINGQSWAFWVLVIAIGFVQIMSFVAFSAIGNRRWQVNIPLSVLYVVGIAMVGYGLIKR